MYAGSRSRFAAKRIDLASHLGLPGLLPARAESALPSLEPDVLQAVFVQSLLRLYLVLHLILGQHLLLVLYQALARILIPIDLILLNCTHTYVAPVLVASRQGRRGNQQHGERNDGHKDQLLSHRVSPFSTLVSWTAGLDYLIGLTSDSAPFTI